MAAPIRFLSGRNQQQKIGIEGSTENQKVLEVVGRVGIGTTIFEPDSELEVRGDVKISGILTAGNIEVSTGQVNFSQVNVSGVSTFAGAIDANGDLDVDGHTELDNVNVSGVSTFAGAIDANGDLDVDGHTELDNVNVSGVSTFVGLGTFKNDLYVNENVYVSGFLTATRLYSSVFGEFTGSSVTADNLVGSALSISGLSTFTGAAEFKSSIDVDGHTELDDLNVSGVSTFAGAADFNGDLDVDGHTELDNVNVSGAITATTFTGNLAGTVNTAAQTNITSLGTLSALTVSGAIDANGGLDVSGGSGLVANTAKISDLTDNRVVIAGNSGELEDSANLTFDGTKLAINGNLGVTGLTTTQNLNVTGVSTFVGLVTVTTGDVHISNRLFVGGLEVEGSGSENTFTGINTFTNLLDNTLGNPDTGSVNVNGGMGVNKNVSFGSTLFVQNAIGIGSAAPIGKLDVDGHTELDDVNVSGAITATTFTGNLAGTVNTAAQTNITSLGTLSALTVSGDITANGNIAGDNSTNITGIAGVTATTLSGTLQTAAQTNITSLGTLSALTVSGDITANGNIAGDNSTNITGIAGVTATTLSGTLQTAAQTNVTSVGTLTGLDVNGHTELDNVNVSGIITTASLNATGKLTTTGIGISIANGAGNTAYIEGPSEIWIDPSPAGAGTTSGSVRIRGDLYVDGTEFIVDVDKIELGDFNIGIASTVSTNSLLDGAGLGIGATSIRKFITWNNATSALMSSENWNLASGKHYEINGTDVLTSTTLGSGVVNSSLTSVGTLSALTVSGDITANGNIAGDNSTNITGIAGVTATTLSGTLQTAAQTNVTSLGTLSALTVSGDITANGNIAGDNSTNITGIAGVTATTLSGTLQTAAQTNVTSLGTLSALTVSGDITANGNITGDNATNISGINSVTATSFYGSGVNLTALNASNLGSGTVPDARFPATLPAIDGSNLTGITASQIGALRGITINEEGSLVGTANSVSSINFVSSNLTATASGVGATITLTNTPTFSSLNVTGITTIPNISGVTTFANDVIVGTGITFYASTGIVSATAFFGNGENLSNLINQRIEGLQIFDEGVAVGTGFTFAALDVVGNNVSISAVGLGSTARITVSDTPTFDTVVVTNNITANGNIVGDNSTNITGINNITATDIEATGGFTGDLSGNATSATSATTATNVTVADESSDTTCFPLFATAATGDLAPKSGSNLTFNSSTGTLTASALSGTLQTAAQTNITSVGTLSALTVSGDITANGNIVGDNSTNISGISALNAAGTVTFGADADDVQFFGTTKILRMGGSSGFQIQEEGVSASITQGTGALRFYYDSGNQYKWAVFNNAGSAELYHANNKKFETTSSGVSVTGTVAATTFSGALSGNADTATTATNVTVADESSDTTCFPLFATAATGDLAPKSGSNLTFNSSNGTLTATTFSGNLPTSDLTGTITNAQLAGSIANSKLANSTMSVGGVTLTLGATDSTPAFNLSDATNYPTSSLSGTITNAQLAGSIANSKLANDSVSFGGVSVDLGSSDSTPAFNLSDATNYPTSSLSGTITNAQLAGSIADGKLASTFLKNVVEDTTPQLGGNLDLNSKFITGTGGISVTGVVTATSLDAAISEWVLGSNGSSDYTFTGPGLTGAENDPSIYLVRGQKYNFKNSSGGHPFRIQSTPNGSTGTQYNDGITNNDAGNGVTLNWNVQFDAPDVLYYQCTSHAAMGGKIYIGNSGESIVVGAAVTINSSGINATGVVTATSFAGDGSSLTNIVSPSSNGEFYTGITSSRQIAPLSFESTVFTFPSTAGKQYVIESINVANVDASVGVGTTVNIIASIQDATAAEQTYIAYNVPIVTGGLIELLKNPIVAGPSDVIKMWSTNDGYTGVSNAAEVYMNYTEFTSTDYISKFASTASITSTDTTTLYTSTSNPTTIEKIGFANRTDTGDFPISIKITNGTTTSYLAKDLIIPRYSTVDILDRPKRIETGAKIEVEVGSTSTVDVIIAGKKITS